MSVSPSLKLSIFSVNDHYPKLDRSVRQLYDEVIDQAIHAEELGYDTFFCAEHHFHEYGVVPDPAVMLSALAQRTERIKLGTAISILTFHDPRRLAESYAMVDMMSDGRLVYGVGSGYLKHEFEGYDENPAEKRDKFNENLDIIKKLMSGERLSYQGQFSKSDNVALNVLPHDGMPPVYVAVLAREAAYHVGKQGNNLMTVPYASCDTFDEIADLMADYRKGQADAGIAPRDDDHVFTLHAHVADTDEQAREEAKDPFDLYVETRLYAKRQVYEDIIKSGLSLFGSRETVTEKLVTLYDWGIRHVVLLNNFGRMDLDKVKRSMKTFMTEVLPEVERRISAKDAAE